MFEDSVDILDVEVQPRFLPNRPSYTLPTTRCREEVYKSERDNPQRGNPLPQHYAYFRGNMSNYNQRRPPSRMTEEDFPMWAYTNGFNSDVNPNIQKFYRGKEQLIYPCYIGAMMSSLQQLNTLCIRGERSKVNYSWVKVNDIIYSDQFKSCSLNINEAVKFCTRDKGGTFFFFQTGQPIMAVRAMEKSRYNRQDEWIVAPGQRFQVTEVVHDAGEMLDINCKGKDKKYRKVVLRAAN